MATNQRQTNKYQLREVRLPVIGSMTNRSSSAAKDQRFVNVFPETRKVEALESTKIFLYKRPGLTLYKNFGTGLGQGIAYFNSKLYIALAGQVYVDGTTPTSVITLTSATAKVGMLVCNSATLGDYLFICDGTSGWYIKTDGSVTQIVDANFPTPHVPVPSYIDGYITLAKGIDVYNCVLDTPGTWNTGEYLSAEIFPDKIVALGRQNNQIIVFGETSTEFFFDAANATGSPLARNDSAIMQQGCAFPYAIYQNEKTCIFVGQSQSGGRAVWQIDGTTPKKVSDEFIDRIIDAETDTLNCYGYGLRTMGHLFYILNLPTQNRTLVYDTEEKLWHEWSSNISDNHAMFAYHHMTDMNTGGAYVLGATDGNVYKIEPTVYTDNSTIILVDITTNRYDMDTYKRKFMSNIRVVGDRYDTNNYVDIRWTDDDYLTWSNTKTIALTDDFPNFARLGSFRRRAFNIKQALPQPLRLESLEVSYYEGDS